MKKIGKIKITKKEKSATSTIYIRTVEKKHKDCFYETAKALNLRPKELFGKLVEAIGE